MLEHDVDEDFFLFTSRMGTQSSSPSNAEHQMFDMLLTVLLVENLCVLCWRGVWGYLDIYFMPDKPHIAAILNTATGFNVLIILGFIQIPLDIFYRRVKIHPNYGFLAGVILEDIMYLICNTALIHFWRGFWEICDLHILLNKPGLSALATHASIFILQFCRVGNTVVSKGCFIDGQPETEAFGILFPNLYIRYYRHSDNSTTTSNTQKRTVDADFTSQETLFNISYDHIKPINAVRPMVSNGILKNTDSNNVTAHKDPVHSTGLCSVALDKGLYMHECGSFHQQMNGYIRTEHSRSQVSDQSNIYENDAENWTTSPKPKDTSVYLVHSF